MGAKKRYLLLGLTSPTNKLNNLSDNALQKALKIRAEVVFLPRPIYLIYSPVDKDSLAGLCFD